MRSLPRSAPSTQPTFFPSLLLSSTHSRTLHPVAPPRRLTTLPPNPTAPSLRHRPPPPVAGKKTSKDFLQLRSLSSRTFQALVRSHQTSWLRQTAGRSDSALKFWNSLKDTFSHHGLQFNTTEALSLAIHLVETERKAPQTVRQYVSKARELCPQDFQALPPGVWPRFLNRIYELDNTRLATGAQRHAQVATPAVIHHHILQGRRPSSLRYAHPSEDNFFRIVAFRLFVTGHRAGDMEKQLYKFHPAQQCVQVVQIFDKDRKKPPWSIYVPATQEQFDRVWKPTPFTPQTKLSDLKFKVF